MKMTFKHILCCAGLMASLQAQAGNEDRVGSAGASQLLLIHGRALLQWATLHTPIAMV